MLERLGIADELAANRAKWARFAYVAPQDRRVQGWVQIPEAPTVPAPPRVAAPLGTAAAIIARFAEVCSETSGAPVTVADLKGPCRKRQIVWPRHVCMLLVRVITGMSTPQIGREFGKRDHTTVLHGLKHADERMAEVPALKAAHDAVAECFKGDSQAAHAGQPRSEHVHELGNGVRSA